MKTIPEVRTFA